MLSAAVVRAWRTAVRHHGRTLHSSAVPKYPTWSGSVGVDIYRIPSRQNFRRQFNKRTNIFARRSSYLTQQLLGGRYHFSTATDHAGSSIDKKLHKAMGNISMLSRARNARVLLRAVDELLESDIADHLGAREFVIMIRELGRCRQAERAIMLHDQMISLGIEPNLHTFSTTLSACAASMGRDESHSHREAEQAAQELFTEMTDLYGIQPDIICQNARLRLCRNYMQAFEHVDNEIVKAGLTPNKQTLSIIVAKGVAGRQFPLVVRDYDKLVQQFDVSEDWFLRGQLLGALVGLKDDGERFKIAFDSLLDDVVASFSASTASGQRKEDPFTAVSAMLHVCARSGRWNDAVQVVERVIGRPIPARDEPAISFTGQDRPTLQLGLRHYKSVLEACANASKGRMAVRLYEKVVPSKMRDAVVTTVMRACNAGGNPKMTLTLYNDIWKGGGFEDNTKARQAGSARGGVLNQYFFQTALIAACDLRQPDRAFMILSNMHSCQIPLGTFALNNVLQSTVGDEQYWPLAVQLFEQRSKAGMVRPNIHTIRTLMQGYRDLGNWEEVTRAYGELSVWGLDPIPSTQRYYLQALLNTGAYAQAVAFVDTLGRKGRARLVAVHSSRLQVSWTRAVNECISDNGRDGLADGIELWKHLRILRGDDNTKAGAGGGDRRGDVTRMLRGYQSLCSTLRQRIVEFQEEDEQTELADTGGDPWLARAADDVEEELEWVFERLNKGHAN